MSGKMQYIAEIKQLREELRLCRERENRNSIRAKQAEDALDRMFGAQGDEIGRLKAALEEAQEEIERLALREQLRG
jgi:hypothetical protein